MQIKDFFNLAPTTWFIWFCGNIPLICFNSSFLLEKLRNFTEPSCFLVVFKSFPQRRLSKLSLLYYFSWIRRQYFFTCKIFWSKSVTIGIGKLFITTLMSLIFAGTKFRGFRGLEGHPRNLIPAKFFIF